MVREAQGGPGSATDVRRSISAGACGGAEGWQFASDISALCKLELPRVSREAWPINYVSAHPEPGVEEGGLGRHSAR